MAKSFDDMASAAKTAWSDDARRVYEAASMQFAQELAERSDLDAQSAAAGNPVLPHVGQGVLPARGSEGD